jgi:RNA recognition motif-containing protein
MNLYVSNLGFDVKDEDLKKIFTSYGEVNSAKIIMDSFSGQSRGFGFVEMSDEDGQKAITELDNKELNGRVVSIKLAKPKEERKGSYQVGSPFSRNSGGFKKRY